LEVVIVFCVFVGDCVNIMLLVFEYDFVYWLLFVGELFVFGVVKCILVVDFVV